MTLAPRYLLRGLVTGAITAIACVSACAPKAYPLSEPEAPVRPSAWADVYAVCITPADHLLGLGSEISAALGAWGVSLPVVVIATDEAPEGCLPVVLVSHVPVKGDEWIGLTATTARDDWRPLSVLVSREFWYACPFGRAWVVRHEIGHAVGHLEHRVDGLMADKVPGCTPGVNPLPDYYERALAERRRVGVK